MRRQQSFTRVMPAEEWQISTRCRCRGSARAAALQPNARNLLLFARCYHVKLNDQPVRIS
jgi:hypothetical protein